jgi:preprotein translocase subunit SecD
MTSDLKLLDQRLHDAGLASAAAQQLGHNRIGVRITSNKLAIVQALAAQGVLRFRRVLEIRSTATAAGQSTVSSGTIAPAPESPALTPVFEQTFKTWSCDSDAAATRGAGRAVDYTIGCDSDGLAYLLAPAALEGSDLRAANAGLDQNGQNWVVDIEFSHAGAAKWLAITKQTYEVNGGRPSQPGSCTPPEGCNSIAIVLDGVVESAPYTETDGIPGGNSQITDNFDQARATDLADILKAGALPLPLRVVSAG